MKTYSPTLDVWETDADSEFEFPYTMDGAGWEEFGTVSAVVSGGATSLPWPGLASLTGYEWYVMVSDGASTVTGPIWSFTTLDWVSAAPGGDFPAVTVLHPAVPNPFNPRTTLSFDMAQPGRVGQKIYGLDGRLVAVLADEYVQAGSHTRV